MCFIILSECPKSIVKLRILYKSEFKYEVFPHRPQVLRRWRCLEPWQGGALLEEMSFGDGPWVFISRTLFLSLLWFLTSVISPPHLRAAVELPAPAFPAMSLHTVSPTEPSSLSWLLVRCEDSVRKGSSIVYLMDPGFSRPLRHLRTLQIQVLHLKHMCSCSVCL